MAATAWGGENWYTEVVSFRRNPNAYLSLKRSNEEDFTFDILQALCHEKVSQSAKIHLLGLLEQFGQTLFPNFTNVEQTTASLMDMYHQTSGQDAMLLRQQMLVTITTLLIEFDYMENQQDQFVTFVELLLEIICHLNCEDDRPLRSTACQCLVEMETFYPGLLKTKLEYLYQMSQMETSHVAQSYMLIFALTLKHAVKHPSPPTEGSYSNFVTDLLCNRTEPLKPYTLPKDLLSLAQSHQEDLEVKVPEDLDTTELRRAISFLMNSSTLLTSAMLVGVVRHIIDIVHKCDTIIPSMFKGLILNFMSSAELPLFALVFYLKECYAAQLFGPTDNDLLVRSVLSRMNHPSLHPAHRLLMFEWLLHVPDAQGQVPTEPSLPKLSNKDSFSCSIFDGINAQLKKARLISLSLDPNDSETSVKMMMRSSVSLLRQVEYGVAGRAASGLFKLLYTYYSTHEESAITDNICRCIVKLILERPQFVPHTLDFLQASEAVHSSHPMSKKILTSLLRSIASSSMSLKKTDLQHHLVVLERAARQQGIQSKELVTCLQELVESSTLCESGDWFIGNLLLAVCRSILQFHDTNQVFHELSNILFSMMNTYQDVDIRDRSKFYYSLLANVSTAKASVLLSKPESGDKTTQGWAGLVTGGNGSSAVLPVIQLNEAVLQMTRIENSQMDQESNMDHCSLKDEDILDAYQQSLQSTSNCIKMSFYLHFAESSTRFQDLYGVVVSFCTEDSYQHIPDFCVPCLSRTTCGAPQAGCQVLVVTLTPLEPVPTTITIHVMFTADDGRTYVCPMPSLEFKFGDLLHPLPVPSSWDIGHRQKLFTQLWQQLIQEHGTSGHLESVCCLQLTPSTIDELLECEWKPLVMSDSREQDKVVCLGIFLPPSSHLLLKIEIEKARSIVSMVTDNFKVLPLVSSYLQQLQAEE